MADNFWINPCGLDKEPLNKDCGSVISDKTIVKKTLEHCARAVKNALDDAIKLQSYLKKRHPSFDVPENYDEIKLFQFLKSAEGNHNICNANSTLPAEYNLIQRHAVGLQQMMADAKDDREYFDYLNEKRRSIVSLLCSLYELILHMGLQRMKDATVDVMPAELRQDKQSPIIMRDNIIAEFYVFRMRHLHNILRNLESKYSRKSEIRDSDGL